MNFNERIRRKIRCAVLDLLPDGFYFKRKGYCPCCKSNTKFVAYDEWLRDHFFCKKCGSIPRERALIYTLEKYYPDWTNLIVHESSPSKNAVSAIFSRRCKNYTASHYFPGQPLGEVINGFRNEDLERQTYPDASFDLVITQDVMEHVYSPKDAFAEISRTLKTGGAHIFTVPLINNHSKTEIWATKGEDGTPVFLKTPEFHGNPINAEGAPVTMHWGCDIVNFIDSNSSMQSFIEYIDNLDFGIRAEYIEVIVSKKV